MRSDRAYSWQTIGVLSVALVLRVLGLNKGIWLDEASSINVISNPDFPRNLFFYDQLPLYFILLKFWSSINNSEEFLRLFSVLLGFGTVAVIMRWIGYYSHFGSLLAGLYCSTLPILLRYSQEIRGYGLLLFVSALSFLFASRITIYPDRRSGYIGLGLSLTAAITTHAIGIMVVPSVCLYLFCAWKRVRLNKVIPAIGVPLVIFLVQYHFHTRMRPGSNWWMPPISAELIGGTASKVFGFSAAVQLIGSWFPSLANDIKIWLHNILTVSFVAALGLVLPVCSRWKHAAPLLAGALLFWLLIIGYSIVSLPIFIDRTTLPGLIPFIGFLGLSISTIRMRRARILFAGGLVLVCFVFGLNWIKNEADKPIEGWKQLAQLIKATRRPNDLLIAYPSFIELPLRYYVDLPIETTVLISRESNVNWVEEETRRRLAEYQRTTDSFAVFLVVRFGPAVDKPEIGRRLATELESRLGPPTFSATSGIWPILSLQKYEFHRPKLRAD